MLAFLFSRTGAALAGIVLAMSFAVWAVTAAYQAGREAERATILNRSVEILRERNSVDDQVSAFDDVALCRALGGVWVLADSTCQ